MSPLLSAKQVTSLDVCPPFVEPSAHFRILSSQSHRCIRSWLIHEQVVLCDPLAPPHYPTHHCCRAERIPCVLQVAEHNWCGVFHRDVGENNTGVSLCRQRVADGGWRREKKKKKATQTAAVLLLLDKNHLVFTRRRLRLQSPLRWKWRPIVLLKDHQFAAQRLHYSSRWSGCAASKPFNQSRPFASESSKP